MRVRQAVVVLLVVALCQRCLIAATVAARVEAGPPVSPTPQWHVSFSAASYTLLPLQGATAQVIVQCVCVADCNGAQTHYSVFVEQQAPPASNASAWILPNGGQNHVILLDAASTNFTWTFQSNLTDILPAPGLEVAVQLTGVLHSQQVKLVPPFNTLVRLYSPPTYPGEVMLDQGQAEHGIVVPDGGHRAAIALHRVGGYGGSLSATLTTRSGTAQPGVSYSHTKGTLSWASNDATPLVFEVPILYNFGQKSATTFHVDIVEATAPIRSARSVQVTIAPSGGVVGFSERTLSVVNNDQGQQLELPMGRLYGHYGRASVSIVVEPGTARHNLPNVAPLAVSWPGNSVFPSHTPTMQLVWNPQQIGSVEFCLRLRVAQGAHLPANTPAASQLSDTLCVTVDLDPHAPGVVGFAGPLTLIVLDKPSQQQLIVSRFAGSTGAVAAQVTWEVQQACNITMELQEHVVVWASGAKGERNLTLHLEPSAASSSCVAVLNLVPYTASPHTASPAVVYVNASAMHVAVLPFGGRVDFEPNQNAQQHTVAQWQSQNLFLQRRNGDFGSGSVAWTAQRAGGGTTQGTVQWDARDTARKHIAVADFLPLQDAVYVSQLMTVTLSHPQGSLVLGDTRTLLLQVLPGGRQVSWVMVIAAVALFALLFVVTQLTSRGSPNRHDSRLLLLLFDAFNLGADLYFAYTTYMEAGNSGSVRLLWLSWAFIGATVLPLVANIVFVSIFFQRAYRDRRFNRWFRNNHEKTTLTVFVLSCIKPNLILVLDGNMFGMAAFTAPLQRLSFLAITGSAVCSLFEDLPQLVITILIDNASGGWQYVHSVVVLFASGFAVLLCLFTTVLGCLLLVKLRRGEGDTPSVSSILADTRMAREERARTRQRHKAATAAAAVHGDVYMRLPMEASDSGLTAELEEMEEEEEEEGGVGSARYALARSKSVGDDSAATQALQRKLLRAYQRRQLQKHRNQRRAASGTSSATMHSMTSSVAVPSASSAAAAAATAAVVGSAGGGGAGAGAGQGRGATGAAIASNVSGSSNAGGGGGNGRRGSSSSHLLGSSARSESSSMSIEYTGKHHG